MDTRTPETNKRIGLVQMDQASLVLAKAESREPDVTLKVNMNELDGASEAEGEKGVPKRERPSWIGRWREVPVSWPSRLLGFNPPDILCRMFVFSTQH